MTERLREAMTGAAGGGRVLVAGIGNVFLGDDGFGVEVVQRLRGADLPDRVDIADYGIRGLHLAYDLLDGRHETLVLVDALPLGEPAGTLAVVEVDTGDDGGTSPPADVLDGHRMDPDSVLRMLCSLGGRVGRVLVVGCQPAALDERLGLSAPVLDALDEAVGTVTRLVRDEVARLEVEAGDSREEAGDNRVGAEDNRVGAEANRDRAPRATPGRR
jgi:hydrogenase maturation protease